MARALDLNNLLAQPDQLRNGEWERAFFQALIEGLVVVNNPEAQPGPDGWPYLFVRTGHEATEPASRVIQWLAAKGIGLVVNGHKEFPDYVFSYGMLWNFVERGEFFSASEKVSPGQVELAEGQKVLAGPPTKEFLPPYVRDILSHFFAQQEISHPKILVLTADHKHYDLCFSLDSMGDPPQEEHQGIAEALAWFLPSHYSILLAHEKGMPQFHPLKELQN